MKELISNLLTAARLISLFYLFKIFLSSFFSLKRTQGSWELIVARKWKTMYTFPSNEWYREVWAIAINNKLRCNIKGKGLISKNICVDIWG